MEHLAVAVASLQQSKDIRYRCRSECFITLTDGSCSHFVASRWGCWPVSACRRLTASLTTHCSITPQTMCWALQTQCWSNAGVTWVRQRAWSPRTASDWLDKEPLQVGGEPGFSAKVLCLCQGITNPCKTGQLSTATSVVMKFLCCMRNCYRSFLGCNFRSKHRHPD